MRRRGFFRPKLRRRGAADDESGGGGVSLRSFRSVDQGGAYVAAQTRTHIAGLVRAAGLGAVNCDVLQGSAVGQFLYAIPEYFEEDGTINRLVTRTNGLVGAAGLPKIKMGVYGNGELTSGIYTGSAYPAARLVQSADLLIGGPNVLLESLISGAVVAGDLLWCVWVCNAQAAANQNTVVGTSRSSLYPIQGFTFNATGATTIAQDMATAGVGWGHAITYVSTDDLPATFPSSAPVLLGAGASTDTINLPAIGYGWQPA